MAIKNLYIIRPGAIKPINGYDNVPFAYRINYAIIWVLYPIAKMLSPSLVIKSTEISKAILYIIKNGTPQKLLGNKEMILLSKK